MGHMRENSPILHAEEERAKQEYNNLFTLLHPLVGTYEPTAEDPIPVLEMPNPEETLPTTIKDIIAEAYNGTPIVVEGFDLVPNGAALTVSPVEKSTQEPSDEQFIVLRDGRIVSTDSHFNFNSTPNFGPVYSLEVYYIEPTSTDEPGKKANLVLEYHPIGTNVIRDFSQYMREMAPKMKRG